MENLFELSDFVIEERIVMLLQELKKKPIEKTDDEIEINTKGEKYLERLDEDTRKILIDYIDQLYNTVAKNEAYLYKHGFIDGIKAFKTLMKF